MKDAQISYCKEVRHATTSQTGCPPASPELAMAGRRRANGIHLSKKWHFKDYILYSVTKLCAICREFYIQNALSECHWAPGTLHHVIIRGIERKEIVKDDHDRQNFVYRMGTIALERRILQSWTAIDIVVI